MQVQIYLRAAYIKQEQFLYFRELRLRAIMKNNTHFYTFASLFLVLIVDTIGFALIMPILAPLYLDPTSGILPASFSLPLKNFFYGLTMSVFFIFTFFGSPFLGTLSDQIGRKKVLMLCLAGVALGFLISGLGVIFRSVWLIIFGRAVGGFSAGSQPIAQAAIIDISTDENKTKNIALITLAGCIGFIVGPIIGGSMSGLFLKNHMGFAIPFLFSTVLAALNALMVYFTFRETFVPPVNRKVQLMSAIFGLKRTLEIKSVRILLVVNLIFQTAWGLYFQFISLYLVQVYHVTTMTLGLFMAFTGLIFALTLTWIIKLLLARFKLMSITIWSVAVFGVGISINLMGHAIWVPWLAMVFVSIGAGLVYTALIALTSNCASRNEQGMIIGSIGSVMSLGWIIAGLSMGVLTKLGIHTPFVMMMCFVLIAFIFLHYQNLTQNKHQRERR